MPANNEQNEIKNIQVDFEGVFESIDRIQEEKSIEDNFNNNDDDVNDDNNKNETNTKDEDNKKGEDIKKEDNKNDNDNDNDNEETDVSIFEALSNSLGYELSNDKKYEASEEGIKQFIEDVTNYKILQKEENLMGEAKELNEFIKNGGNTQEFFKLKAQIIDYTDYKLTEGDVMAQEKIIRDNLKKSNLDDTSINMVVDSLKEKGTLYESAKTALTSLKQKTLEEMKKLDEDSKRQKEEFIKSRSDFTKAIVESSKKESFYNLFKISDKKREDFKKYVFSEDGSITQFEKDLNAASAEDVAIVAYIIQNKANIREILNRSEISKSNEQLKKLLSGNPSSKDNKKEQDKKRTVSIDFNNI